MKRGRDQKFRVLSFEFWVLSFLIFGLQPSNTAHRIFNSELRTHNSERPCSPGPVSRDTLPHRNTEAMTFVGPDGPWSLTSGCISASLAHPATANCSATETATNMPDVHRLDLPRVSAVLDAKLVPWTGRDCVIAGRTRRPRLPRLHR